MTQTTTRSWSEPTATNNEPIIFGASIATYDNSVGAAPEATPFHTIELCSVVNQDNIIVNTRRVGNELRLPSQHSTDSQPATTLTVSCGALLQQQKLFVTGVTHFHPFLYRPNAVKTRTTHDESNILSSNPFSLPTSISIASEMVESNRKKEYSLSFILIISIDS